LDEVFSTGVLLKKIKKERKFFQLIRTRDKNIIEKWRKERNLNKREVYIYDIGGKYDWEKNEFDHHQIGGADKRENGIEYSSAGLIWKHFGLDLVGEKYIWEKIDKEFVVAIDAIDNGQEIVEKKYGFKMFDLNDLLNLYFPKKRSENKMKKSFLRAVKLVQFILERKIKKAQKNLEDIQKLKEIYQNSKDKRFLVVEDEKISTSLITDLFPDVLFVVKKQKDDVWYIQTIRVKKDEFLRRKYLPKDWGGLEGKELDKVTGLDGGIFCHRALFVASAKTKDVAVEMVKIVLKK